jgi:hypothetical protein
MEQFIYMQQIASQHIYRYTHTYSCIYWCYTTWTVRGSNTCGGRWSTHVQNGPGPHPAPCTMSIVYFQDVNLQGRCVDQPPKFRAEVRERVEIYLYHLLDYHRMFWVNITFTLHILNKRKMEEFFGVTVIHPHFKLSYFYRNL